VHGIGTQRRSWCGFERACGSIAGEKLHEYWGAAWSRECRLVNRLDRGERNVERAYSARNRECLRKLLSLMLIAHVECCGDCAKYMWSQRDDKEKTR